MLMRADAVMCFPGLIQRINVDYRIREVFQVMEQFMSDFMSNGMPLFYGEF